MPTPTDPQTRGEMVVLSDEAGAYYLLAREVVERARVPREQQAALDRALAGEDVAGFGLVVEERPALTASATGLLGGLSVRGIIVDWQPAPGGAATGIVIHW